MERKSNVKHEYYKGEIFPWVAGLEHNMVKSLPCITTKDVILLKSTLKWSVHQM